VPNFAENVAQTELLDIVKSNLDSLDPARVRPDKIIGVDNVSKLKVATVFAAIAIESALNDYILIHCLFVERPYLQNVFGEISKRFLRSSVLEKIDFLRRHWRDEFPAQLISDVKNLFRIRNKVTHQTGEYLSADSNSGKPVLRNVVLTLDEMQHMRRHHAIATDFLSRFWLPGSREVNRVVPFTVGDEEGDSEMRSNSHFSEAGGDQKPEG